MSAHCCGNTITIKKDSVNKGFKNALIVALVLNFGMFLLENFQSIMSHSLSLRADAIDFLGDSANYFITLFVISKTVKTKASVSLLKASFMFGFGVWILIEALLRFFNDTVPNSITMSWVGMLALIVNLLVAVILYRFRDGDSNMQSVWLCTRNDVVGNIAVVLASIGVFYLNSKWPDLIVAGLMAWLAASASYKVLLIVLEELKSEKKLCSN